MLYCTTAMLLSKSLLHAELVTPCQFLAHNRPLVTFQTSSGNGFQFLQHPAYQRLSLRLGTSDVSNEGFCCNLCAPLVVDIHLKQSN